MTAQVGDSYKWNKKEYFVIAISAPVNFRPEDHGLIPAGICSGCWNGYWCEYEINQNGLFLQNLFINDRNNIYPDLNGVAVSKGKKVMGHRSYKNVMLQIPYTGKIVAGCNFLRNYYIHMGYQRAWAYEEVWEFIFENGKLIKTLDHSEIIRNIRKEVDEKKINVGWSDGTNLVKFIDESFSLDIEDKAWWITG